MPSVLRIQYAYDLIQNQDREAAQKWKRLFEKVEKNYPF